MNELLNTGFFSLFAEPSQKVTNEEIQNAYECFMEEVRTVGQSENDYLKVFRAISITRIELASLELIYRYGQGEKCPEIYLS